MKAAYLARKAGAEALEIGEMRQPSPAAGEILVKVHAAAVTPTELDWFPTFHTPGGEPRPFPVVLGHEFSGTIAATAPDVSSVLPGEAVYGMNSWFRNGANAEYCLASVESIAPKPRSLDHHHAAAVPISALTAWQGLFDRGSLKPRERVLIHGASGGVGVFAVQLARRRGAHVIATASATHVDFVRELGADEVLDYRGVPFESAVSDVDLVFDAVGGDTLRRSWGILNDKGRIVTIAAQSESTADERTRAAFFIVEPNRTQLVEIAALLDAGDLRVFVETVYPLARAREAYDRAKRGGMRGKVVIEVAAGHPELTIGVT